MSHRDPNNQALALGTVVLAVAIGYLIFRFSSSFGLNFHTGALVLGLFLLWTGVTFVISQLRDSFPIININTLWPYLLGLLWMVWWPALDHWAVKELPALFAEEDSSVQWWAAWYTKWGIFAGIVGLGLMSKNFVSGR